MQVDSPRTRYAKGLQIEGPPPFYGQWPNQIGRNLQIEAPPPTYGIHWVCYRNIDNIANILIVLV